MKKRIIFIVILASIVGFVFVANKDFFWKPATTAYAVGDLTVDWGIGVGDVGPIFNVLNMAPGDIEERDVDVSNSAVTARPIGVRGLMTSGQASFSAALKIVISEGGTDLYGGTSGTGEKSLSDFFTESAGPDGIPLSTLGPGGTTTYTFKVTFAEDSGNEFQNLSVMFDLKIGIAIAVPAECEDIEFDLVDGLPIFGTDGNDRINGTRGNDLIFGFEGNDRIFGHGGHDCLVGNEGNDELRGEVGNDFLFGNEGNDLLIGAVGNDFISGGDGNDNIRGENNNDLIEGGDGDDKITGGNGNDVINAGIGNDDVSSENGADEINGGAGNDKLDGGSGNDLIHGNSGDDQINGKSGNDTLIGDEDTDSINGHSGTDTCEGEVEVNCEL